MSGQAPTARQPELSSLEEELIAEVHELEAQLAAQRDVVAAQRKALEHYANADYWSAEDGDPYTVFVYDGGHSEPWKVARDALAVAAVVSGTPEDAL
jgi:hypothetical protein